MISKFSVKRPYTVIVGVILVIVLGVVSFTRMTTDLLPDMNLPYALVITTDVGASPEEVEADVTAPVEASMATTSSATRVRPGLPWPLRRPRPARPSTATSSSPPSPNKNAF